MNVPKPNPYYSSSCVHPGQKTSDYRYCCAGMAEPRWDFRMRANFLVCKNPGQPYEREYNTYALVHPQHPSHRIKFRHV